MRVRHLTDEIPDILRSLTGPVSHITSSTRNCIANVASGVSSPVSNVTCDIVYSTGNWMLVNLIHTLLSLVPSLVYCLCCRRIWIIREIGSTACFVILSKTFIVCGVSLLGILIVNIITNRRSNSVSCIGNTISNPFTSSIGSTRDSSADITSSLSNSACSILDAVCDLLPWRIIVHIHVLIGSTKLAATLKVVAHAFVPSAKAVLFRIPISISGSVHQIIAIVLIKATELPLILGFLPEIVSGVPVSDVLRCVCYCICCILSNPRDSPTDILSAITDPVASILNRAANVLHSLTSQVTHGIRSSAYGVSDVFNRIASPISNSVSSTTDSITYTVEETTNASTGLFGSLADGIADVLSGIRNCFACILCSLANITSGIADPLASAVEETGSALACVRSGLRSGVLYIIRSTVNPLAGTVKEALSAFCGFIGSIGNCIAYVLSCLPNSIAYVLSNGADCISDILYSITDPITYVLCRLTDILRAITDPVSNSIGGVADTPEQTIICLLLGILSFPSVLLIAEVVSNLLVSFCSCPIRISGNVLVDEIIRITCQIANSITDILDSILNCSTYILSSSGYSITYVLSSIRYTFTSSRPQRNIRSFLGGFSGPVSSIFGSLCTPVTRIASRCADSLSDILCSSLRNAWQGLGLLLVIVVRGSLLGLLRIAHHSSCRALILVLLPVLIAGNKVRALIHSGPGRPCSVGDTLGYILSSVIGESANILAGVLQPFDITIIGVNTELVFVPLHALYTVVL